MCEIQCLIFECCTNKVGEGQISHNPYIKRFFVQVLSCIITWKGCTLKILTFIFLHWFMQCPNVGLHKSVSLHVNFPHNEGFEYFEDYRVQILYYKAKSLCICLFVLSVC